MMEITFEKIIKSHLKEVKDILNYYIINSTSAYREDKIDEDFASCFLEGSDVYHSFVIKNNVDEVIGFCVPKPFMNISTFAEAADVIYFIHPEYTGKGIGGQILKKVEAAAGDRYSGIKANKIYGGLYRYVRKDAEQTNCSYCSRAVGTLRRKCRIIYSAKRVVIG